MMFVFVVRLLFSRVVSVRCCLPFWFFIYLKDHGKGVRVRVGGWGSDEAVV